jgi:hypothetical protein
MALVEFIEQDGRDPIQVRILNQLTEEDSFRDEANAGARGGDVLEPDLVPDFVAKPGFTLGRDAGCEEAGGEAARLEDDDLAVAKDAMIEENLRDLGGFSGAGGSLDDETGMGAKIFYDRILKFVDG